MTVYRLDGPEAAVVLRHPDVPHESSLAFSPDSRFLAAAHRDESVSVYDLEASPVAKEVHRRQPGLPLPLGLAFRPGRPHLAVSGGNMVRVIDLEGDKVSLADLSHPSRAGSMAWHPDGRTLASTCADLRIRLWDVDSGKPPLALERHKKPGVTVAFSPAGDCLASNDWSGLLRLWDPRTGRQLLLTPSTAGEFSRDGGLLVEQTGSRLRLLRVAIRRPLRCLTAFGDAVWWDMVTARPSPDGRLLLVGWGDRLAFVDWASGAEVESIPLRASSAVLFEPGGALLTSGLDGLIRWPLRQAEAGRLHVGPPQRLTEPGNPPHHPHGCSADGRVIAILGRRNPCAIVVHRPENRRVPLGRREDVRYCAVSPDGRWVATGNHWNHEGVGATVWDAGSGQAVKDFPISGEGCAVGFSPDGRWLLTNGGGVRLWRVGTWEEGPTVTPPGQSSSCAFAPDGRVLALSGGFSQVRLVEVDSGAEIARLTVPEQTRVGPQCFSPDGRSWWPPGPRVSCSTSGTCAPCAPS